MTQKPQTHCGDLARLPAALAPLTAERRWVVWPWELRESKGGRQKWTKPPRQTRDPSRNARSNDPSTWGTYNDAVAAVRRGNADGIGYMLLGSSIGAVDLDHVVEDARLLHWAEQLCDEASGTYQETTVSGAGLRIIGTASGPETHRKFTFDRTTGAGIELYRDTARYITVSGLETGHCAELPPLDHLIDTLLARHGYGQAQPLDFNTAGPQRERDYEALIQNGAPEGERSELFQAVVWHLAGQGRSAEQIADELAKHPNGIGAKYADRLLAEVTRSYEKWRAHKRAAVTGGVEAPAGDWPQIVLTAGELPRIVNEAEDALLGLRREVYQRGGLLVRPLLLPTIPPNDDWKLTPLTRPWLVEALTCAARFLRWDGRAKGFVPVDAPDDVADALLSRGGNWKLPILSGVTKTPFLRRDGSICETPGYDAASGQLYKPGDETFPSIPQQPSRDDALEALQLLEDLDRRLPLRRTGGPRRGAERHPDYPRPPQHDRGAAARLHLANGRHRQVAAGRCRRHARHPAADAGDQPRPHRGGAGEAPRCGAFGGRYRHRLGQLRAPAGKQLPVPGAHATKAQHSHAWRQQERGDAGQRRDLRHRQQPHHRRRSDPPHPDLRPRRPLRAAGAAHLRHQHPRDSSHATAPPGGRRAHRAESMAHRRRAR
jgi:hypothetical protein